MHHPQRWNVTTSIFGLKNGHMRKYFTQNGWPQRYSWEGRRRRILGSYGGPRPSKMELPSALERQEPDSGFPSYTFYLSLFSLSFCLSGPFSCIFSITLFIQCHYLKWERDNLNCGILLHMQKFHWFHDPPNSSWETKKKKKAFFFFSFPSYISGVHHFGWDFCVCDCFFNPTIEVVTFCLHGWCMLGVFLLLAITCLGHECQDLLNPCNGMHVCTD